MEDSKLGIGILSGQRIRLWERMANSEWLLRRTLELEKILSLKPQAEPWCPVVLGFAEESNAVFVLTAIGVFMIQLDSLQFRNLFESNFVTSFYPYTSFYTAGNCLSVNQYISEPTKSDYVLYAMLQYQMR